MITFPSPETPLPEGLTERIVAEAPYENSTPEFVNSYPSSVLTSTTTLPAAICLGEWHTTRDDDIVKAGKGETTW